MANKRREREREGENGSCKSSFYGGHALLACTRTRARIRSFFERLSNRTATRFHAFFICFAVRTFNYEPLFICPFYSSLSLSLFNLSSFIFRSSNKRADPLFAKKDFFPESMAKCWNVVIPFLSLSLFLSFFFWGERRLVNSWTCRQFATFFG